MPSTVDTLVPLYLNKSRKGTDVPLPISEKNTMAFIKPHRVTPSIRDEFTRELLTGNYTQQERLEPTGRYYTAEDLASGVGGVTDCVLRAIDQTGGAAPLIQPELEIGYYSHGNFDYYHYGKMAIAETAGLDNHVTTFDCDPSVPVYIAIWTRDECNAAVPHRVVREVPNEDSFSGELTSGGRDSSRSTILDEYFYNEDAEYEFNRQIFEEFDTPAAHGTATSRELKRHGDYIGFGNGEDCQYFYTKFFPLEPSALIDPVIYTILGEDDNRTDVQEWTVVDNFLSSAASDYHCVVDKDLGIIRFGGVLGGAAVTKEAVPTSAVDYIEVLTTENLAHSGRVTIDDGTNSETITYTGKTETKLLGITRAGTPLALSAGATVTTVQTGAVPGLGYQIIALYCAKARVDYQPVSDRSDNASTRATRHVNEYTPYQLHNNESILCIDRCNPKLGSVTVKALDLGSIRTDAGEVCQGPVYMNQDTVTLEVCVKDSSGSPMANTEVEVYVSSGGGYLDYVTRVNGVTDTEGKFWTTYIPDPTQTFQAVYARAADSSHVTGNTVLDFTYPAGYKIEPEDLNLSHVYAVLKDDPVIGSVGRFHETPILQWNAHADAGTRVGTPLSLVDNAVLLDLSSTADDGLYFWDAPWLENTDSFKGGKLKIGYVASPYTGAAQPITYIEVGVVKVVKYSRMWSLALPDNSVRHHTYVVLIDKKLPSVANSVVETWIKRPGDVDWNAADMNGRMTALRALKNAANNPDPGYTPWEQGDTVTDMATGTWLHPSSPDHTSLYKPVVPEAHLGGNSFQFDGTLPLPDESDDKNVLGAYAIFGNTKTKIQASVKDPSCHAKYLLSNELCLINARSPRDIGTYLDGSYVPYGWRLLTSDFDAASTLDTATYLTFNDMNRVATSEGSAADFLAPMVSVVESGAIMYDSDSVYDSLPAGISFEIVAEP